jgi:acetamidase/formamidase
MKPLSMLFGVLIIAGAGSAEAETFTLKVAPETVAWGNYDANAKPVLRIKSGDTVIFETLLTNSPTGLERNGVPPDQVEKSLRDVFEHVPLSDRGPGGHILTGPVFVEGAEPGDTLQIQIKRISLAMPTTAFATARAF